MAVVNDELTNRIRKERHDRMYPFDEMNKYIASNPLPINTGMCKHEYGCVDTTDTILRRLKSQEPNSNNLFFRNSIIGYEWGDLQRAIVYSERFSNNKTSFKVSEGNKVMFRDGFKDKSTILAEGKLAMADLLTQLCLLCISLEELTGDSGWNFNELRKLGAQHLEERHKDFKRDGWTEVEK